jgi:hypothetical protein
MKRETADAGTGRPYAFVRIKRTALPVADQTSHRWQLVCGEALNGYFYGVVRPMPAV